MKCFKWLTSISQSKSLLKALFIETVLTVYLIILQQNYAYFTCKRLIKKYTINLLDFFFFSEIYNSWIA